MRTFLTPMSLLLFGCSQADVAPPDDLPPPDEQMFAVVVEQYPVEETSFEGFDVVQHLPDDPVGLAFLFHGTGGSAQFARKIESVDFLNDLVAAGVGFVATESTNRDDRQWVNNSLDVSTNVDLARLERLRSDLIGDGRVGQGTPILGVGMSNGAGFAGLFGHAMHSAGWPMQALSLHAGPVVAAVRNDGGLQVPTFFTVEANDTVVDNDNIRSHYETMLDDSVAAEWRTGVEVALHPRRFVRVEGIDEATSEAVFEALVDSGIVDADGVRLLSLLDADAALADLDLPAGAAGYGAALRSQLMVVWAAHVFSAGWKADEVAFLLDP